MPSEFKNMDIVIQQAAELMAESIRDEAISKGLFNTGKLAKSYEGKVVWNNGKFQIQIFGDVYGAYQDAGFFRPPGKNPPVQPIIDWIIKKRISVPSGMSVESFAYAVQHKIGKVGAVIKPKNFIQPGIDRVVTNFLTPKLEEAGVKDIENIVTTFAHGNKIEIK